MSDVLLRSHISVSACTAPQGPVSATLLLAPFRKDPVVLAAAALPNKLVCPLQKSISPLAVSMDWPNRLLAAHMWHILPCCVSIVSK